MIMILHKNRVRVCADDVQNRKSCQKVGVKTQETSQLVCGGDLKTFANVYPGVTSKLAYFNQH